MKTIGLFFTLALMLAAGCELAARPKGTQLAQGRDIEAPVLVWAGERPLLWFDRVVGESTTMHAIPFDGDAPEAAWSDMSTWSTWQAGSGTLVAQQVANISVFTPESGVPIRSLRGAIDEIAGDELLFHQGASVGAAAFLTHLSAERIWDVGSLDQEWLAPDGRLYYLSRTGIFRSLKVSDSAPTTADRLASRFAIAPDQTYAVARESPAQYASAAAETRDRLLLLPSLQEAAILPLDHRDCPDCADWLGFSPSGQHFYYAENRRSEASIVHELDVQTLNVQSVVSRPGPSAHDLLWSPRGDLGLLGEEPCREPEAMCRVLRRAILRPGPTLEPLSSAVTGASFSPDGSYLRFEDALIGGRLLVAPTDALSPEPNAAAAVLSPEGSILDGATFDPDTNTVVFWARPLGGKSSITLVHSADRSNLYAAAPPAFAVRRLAESVDTVAIGRGCAVALVRFSPQDLTGDLVLYDLRSGHEHNLASPVSAFWVGADCPTAGSSPLGQKWQGSPTRSTEIGQGCPESRSLLLTFVVRGRVKSSMDGLWSLRLSIDD